MYLGQITAAPASTGGYTTIDPTTAAMLSLEFGEPNPPAFPASSTSFVPSDVVSTEDEGMSGTTIAIIGAALVATAAAAYVMTR